MVDGDSYTKDWGSRVAKSGFKNEEDIVKKINNWESDSDAEDWLRIIFGSLDKIKNVQCENLSNNVKPDICINIEGANSNFEEYVSIKKAKSSANYNQIDKRWVEDYSKLWGFDKETEAALKMFVGRQGWSPNEISNKYDIQDISSLRDNRYSDTPRRLYIDELPDNMKNSVLEFLEDKMDIIIDDIISGTGEPEAKWIMVTKFNEDGVAESWHLSDISSAIDQISGDVTVSNQGNIKLGDITVQRKGGDNGRETAQMLQFKMNPLDLEFNEQK